MATTNHARHRGASDDAEHRPAVRRRLTERRDQASRQRLVERVIAEFREMPCLRLTADEAGRLFGLRPDVSARIIAALANEGRLRQDDDGRYASGPVS